MDADWKVSASDFNIVPNSWTESSKIEVKHFLTNKSSISGLWVFDWFWPSCHRNPPLDPPFPLMTKVIRMGLGTASELTYMDVYGTYMVRIWTYMERIWTYMVRIWTYMVCVWTYVVRIWTYMDVNDDPSMTTKVSMKRQLTGHSIQGCYIKSRAVI